MYFGINCPLLRVQMVNITIFELLFSCNKSWPPVHAHRHAQIYSTDLIGLWAYKNTSDDYRLSSWIFGRETDTLFL